MNKLNFVICSLPRMSMMYPPGAPALLKSVIQRENFSCKVIDFVADWYQSFKDHPSWIDIDGWNAIMNFKLVENLEMLINKKISHWAEQLIDSQAEWIGLSIFSYESHKIGQLLAEKIKSLNHSQKIFMGGSGITNISEKYPEKLLEQGIIDAYITGEGEKPIIELAKGNLNYPGINNKKYAQLSKEYLDQQPNPDFSDYNLSLYGKENLGVYSDLNQYNNLNQDVHTLPITGSRGCVRKCTYCDVPLLWPQFTHRGGDLVADEIIEHNKKNGTRKFHFTDSLVNGSMKEFRKMIDILAKYNQDFNANITWTGQFIFRPQGQHTQEDWKLIGQSGGSVLEVGIESGSETIRYQMGKKFSNDDVEYEFANCQRNKVAVFFNVIVGYPTETDQHFEESKDFLTRFHTYAYDQTILDVELGGTLRIQPNTPLYHMMNKLGIEMIPIEHGPPEDLLWWSKKNPTLTLSKRILRRFELGKHAKDLRYRIPANFKDLRYLWSKWNQLKDIEKKWLYERKNKITS